VKIVEMQDWVPEAINTGKDNETLISGLVQDLKGTQPGQQALSIGGDTLIFAAINDNGEPEIYECTIRRVSSNVNEEARPEGAVPVLQEQKYLV
jgi:hypothetical protein